MASSPSLPVPFQHQDYLKGSIPNFKFICFDEMSFLYNLYLWPVVRSKYVSVDV